MYAGTNIGYIYCYHTFFVLGIDISLFVILLLLLFPYSFSLPLISPPPLQLMSAPRLPESLLLLAFLLAIVIVTVIAVVIV